MATAKPTPDLKIPSSEHTVSVSIIDTTARIEGIPMAAFVDPAVGGYHTLVGGLAYSFLIKHDNPEKRSKHDRLLFDLGVRKDIENSPKSIIEAAMSMGWQMTVEKNVFDILKDVGVDDPATVGGIIWSHYHSDHTGDPSTFPSSTDLIVGPGFKKNLVPAWPTVPDSQVDEKAWEGRELVEIAFDSGLTLGGYKALDFYGDGSLYLIDSPGHAIGHMCALARTSANPPEFVLMGGDIAHHGSVFRPSEFKPLPAQIEPNPLVAPFAKANFICPGSIFEAIHPKRSSTEPFTRPMGFLHDDKEGACESVEKFLPFDAQDNVIAIIAHDRSLLEVLDFYPKTLKDWKKKGFKEQGHWRFLRDFDTGEEKYKPQ